MRTPETAPRLSAPIRKLQISYEDKPYHDVKASPLPTDGNIPDRQGDVDNDIYNAPEDDGWPARTVQDCIRDPGVHKCRNDLHCAGTSWICVDLRDCVLGLFVILQILREYWSSSSSAIVEAP